MTVKNTVGCLLLLVSAMMGVLMLLTASGLIMTRTWRHAGLIMLGAGIVGATLSLATLLALNWSLGTALTPVETRVIFTAAGFGWTALVTIVAIALIALLRQPNRWVERRRSLNA